MTKKLNQNYIIYICFEYMFPFRLCQKYILFIQNIFDKEGTYFLKKSMLQKKC